MKKITITVDDVVALRKESVDRNIKPDVSYSIIVNVALRKESVDRNTNPLSISSMIHVALRKESVDRNCWLLAP